MKQTIKTSRTAGYLEKMFRALNQNFFGGKIEEPVITIQSTPRAYGHITVAKQWHRADGEDRHELNIGAGTLDRPIEAIVATMLHEMVHLANLQDGIQDTSRGGTYHNKRFRARAESVGLIIRYDPKIGWSITEPGDALIDLIIREGWTDISMGRQEGYTGTDGTTPGAGTGIDKPTPTGSTSRKIQCPRCGLSVRATRDGLRIKCMDCDTEMMYV